MALATVVDLKKARTRCQHCGKKRPTLAVKYGDPYCSRVCSEKAAGTFDSNRRYDHTLKELRWPASWKHGSNVLRESYATRREALSVLPAEVLGAAVKTGQIQTMELRNHETVFSRRGIEKLAQALQEL